tara:strand:+ start:129 stop:362 length:234 start_codon:yes stop_codon:yes gene_type:complete
MIGPFTDIVEITKMEAVRGYLPATAREIAAQMDCTVDIIHKHLWVLSSKGLAAKSGRTVPNGTTKQGSKNSPIWVKI